MEAGNSMIMVTNFLAHMEKKISTMSLNFVGSLNYVPYKIHVKFSLYIVPYLLKIVISPNYFADKF